MMKFTVVVLFGLLAVACAEEDFVELSKKTSDFETGIYGSIVQTSDDFIETISLPYDAVYKKSRKMIATSIDKINSLFTKSKGSLSAIFKSFDEKLAAVKNNCSENIKAQIQKTESSLILELKQCSDGVKNDLEDRQYDLDDLHDEFPSKYENYNLAAVKCITFNSLLINPCVYNAMNKHYAEIREFGKKLFKKSLDFTNEAISKQREVSKCYTGVLENAALKTNKISKELEVCQKKFEHKN